MQGTRTLALDELDRMARLVDDLLTLAKSESADFVQPCATDIGRLTHETLDTAPALAPRRRQVGATPDLEAGRSEEHAA